MRLYKSTLSFTALTLCVLHFAVAAEPSSSSAQHIEAQQLALEAVRLSYPANLARQESIRAFDEQFRRNFGANPQNVALEKRFPGITDAMAASGSTEMAALLREIEPQLIGAVANDLAARVSASDIKFMIQFYKSSAGRALLSLDPSLMDRQTGMVPISSLSVENRAAIGRYQSSEAGQRVTVATAKSLAIIPTTAGRLFAPYQSRLNATLAVAAKAFIAKGPK